MSTSAKLWLIPAALFVVAGIASLIAQIFFLPGPVEQQDWRAPAEYVLEHLGPDDAVTVQPAWNEDPFPFLTAVGSQGVRQRSPLFEDVHDRERLWLLTESARLDEALSRMPFEASETRAFGPVTVVRLDAPEQPTISYDFLSRLDEAQVTHVKDGEVVERCTNWKRRERAWHCGKPDRWIFVGEELLDVGGDAHQCIWAHPPPDEKRLQITYPDVPIGQTLRVRGGLNQRATRSSRGTDVHYRVRVGDEWSETRTIPANESSWKPLDVDTAKLDGEAGEASADVTVEVWSESVFDRIFCINGWVFEDPSTSEKP